MRLLPNSYVNNTVLGVTFLVLACSGCVVMPDGRIGTLNDYFQGKKAVTKTPESKTSPQPKHDPATLAAVRQELEESTGEDRASFAQTWRDLDPKALWEIIKARRLSRNLAKQYADVQKRLENAIKPAGHTSKPEPAPKPQDAFPSTLPGDKSPVPPVEPKPQTRPQDPYGLPVIDDPKAPAKPVNSAKPGEMSVQPPTHSAFRKSAKSLADQLEAELKNAKPGHDDNTRQDYITKHVTLRTLRLAAGDSEKAIAQIPGLSAAETDYWQLHMWGLADYLSSKNIPKRDERLAQAIAQFRRGVRRLSPEAKLELRNVGFVQEVDGFGNFTPAKKTEFPRGREVLVYAEVQNFSSLPDKNGLRFRSTLRGEIEIRRIEEDGAAGEVVKQIPYPVSNDVCRNPRTDYYHWFEVPIHSDLKDGKYQLRLVVTDVPTRRVAEYSLPFSVK